MYVRMMHDAARFSPDPSVIAASSLGLAANSAAWRLAVRSPGRPLQALLSPSVEGLHSSGNPYRCSSDQGGTQKSKALLADEPTTGLDGLLHAHSSEPFLLTFHRTFQASGWKDTFQAADMVQLLSELGKARRCATILLASSALVSAASCEIGVRGVVQGQSINPDRLSGA